ncbi:MAG: MYXO-CTERM sorting domain-containing protein [Bradymonadaceae bacterium]
MHYMADEEHGFVDYNEEGGAAGKAWAAWPTHFLPYDNERLKNITRKQLNNTLEKVKGKSGNFNYPTKIAIGAAISLSKESNRKKALEIAERMASEIANQKTWTIGESVVPVDNDQDGKTDDFINGVSTPHLWSSILVYVTAVAYHAPEKFDPHMDVLPDVTVPEVTPPGVDPEPGDGGDAGDTGPKADVDSGEDASSTDTGNDSSTPPKDEGCSCAASPARGPVGGAWIGFLLVVLAAGWRRRR